MSSRWKNGISTTTMCWPRACDLYAPANAEEAVKDSANAIASLYIVHLVSLLFHLRWNLNLKFK